MAQGTNPASRSQLEQLIDMTLKSISDADDAAAVARVQRMRDEYTRSTGRPEAGSQTETDPLVERLIKSKTLKAGMVGAATSGAAVIPGVGTVAALTLGVATDVGVTLKLQADLVLEIAAAHGHVLSDQERRNALMLVTGANLGTERLVNEASRRLARKAGERFAGRAFIKVIPFVGVAASAAANMITTYAIGKRADAYFGLGPEAAGDVDASLRALTGVDERKLVEWLSEVLASVGQSVGLQSQRAGQSAARLGRATSNALANGIGNLRTRRQRRLSQRRQQTDDDDDAL